MNTPKPCDICEYLYWDVMAEDDPGAMAECMGMLPMGNMNCPKYKSRSCPIHRSPDCIFCKQVLKEIGKQE